METNEKCKRVDWAPGLPRTQNRYTSIMPFFVLLTNMDKCRWLFLKFAYFLSISLSKIYRKITKISLGAYIFQKPFLRGLFLEGLIFGGAYIRRELCVSKSVGLILGGNLRLKIHWASL